MRLYTVVALQCHEAAAHLEREHRRGVQAPIRLATEVTAGMIHLLVGASGHSTVWWPHLCLTRGLAPHASKPLQLVVHREASATVRFITFRQLSNHEMRQKIASR